MWTYKIFIVHYLKVFCAVKFIFTMRNFCALHEFGGIGPSYCDANTPSRVTLRESGRQHLKPRFFFTYVLMRNEYNHCIFYHNGNITHADLLNGHVTFIQRRINIDASTLTQSCINVMCPLGSRGAVHSFLVYSGCVQW